MAARQVTDKKPKNMEKIIRTFLCCPGSHKFAPLFAGVLVITNAGASPYGTYLLNPSTDNYILPHNYDGFVRAVPFMGLMYVEGVLRITVYKQLVTHTVQSIVEKIRGDLFSKM